MNKVVVMYSGGLDSTVLLKKCTLEFDEVVALNFNYGSKHNYKERRAARKITEKLSTPYYEYYIPTTCEAREPGGYTYTRNLLKSDLLESGGDIPEGHYADESMRRTVVPYRNSIMLSIAAGFAESIGVQHLVIANHAGDYFIYPDCRPEYITAMTEAIFLGGLGQVRIESPFVHMTKSDIVKLGVEIGAPVYLSWSCYKRGEKHCGLCGTCRERREAFKLSDVPDPTEYEHS